jgi:DNA-binding MarR family transcriptional regulator
LISITEEGLELWRSIVALRSNLLAAGLMFLSVSERAALRAALPALEHLVEELQGSEGRTMREVAAPRRAASGSR